LDFDDQVLLVGTDHINGLVNLGKMLRWKLNIHDTALNLNYLAICLISHSITSGCICDRSGDLALRFGATHDIQHVAGDNLLADFVVIQLEQVH
jgi:hypothetical protein